LKGNEDQVLGTPERTDIEKSRKKSKKKSKGSLSSIFTSRGRIKGPHTSIKGGKSQDMGEYEKVEEQGIKGTILGGGSPPGID